MMARGLLNFDNRYRCTNFRTRNAAAATLIASVGSFFRIEKRFFLRNWFDICVEPVIVTSSPRQRAVYVDAHAIIGAIYKVRLGLFLNRRTVVRSPPCPVFPAHPDPRTSRNDENDHENSFSRRQLTRSLFVVHTRAYSSGRTAEQARGVLTMTEKRQRNGEFPRTGIPASGRVVARGMSCT